MTEDDKTVAKTLWSETILEILYESLRRNKDDATIIEILKEVNGEIWYYHILVRKV